MVRIERPSSKRVVIHKNRGHVLVSSDLHGHLEDFRRLQAIFAGLRQADPDAVWVSLGDWVHGPRPGGRPKLSGENLFDYPDDSAALVAELHALEATVPDRFFTLLGNHEHAHIGGRPVGRFRPDEAAHLESQLSLDQVENLHRMLRAWPLLIQCPSMGVIFAHGAPDDDLSGPEVVDDAAYEGGCPRDSGAFLEGVLWNYGYVEPGGGRAFLDRMSVPPARYDLVIHGHDRHRDGGGADGDHAYLLCTSFGALRARKAYLVLDAARRYALADLVEGREIFRLHPELPQAAV